MTCRSVTHASTGPAGDDAPLKASLDAAASGEAPAVAEPAAGEPAATSATEGAAAGAPQSIRVAVEVLEELMVLVSELVLTRNQLMQLARNDESGARDGEQYC